MFYRNLIVLHETSQHKFINNEKYFSVENAKGFFDSDSFFIYNLYTESLPYSKKMEAVQQKLIFTSLTKNFRLLKLLMGQYIKVSLFIIFNQNS